MKQTRIDMEKVPPRQNLFLGSLGGVKVPSTTPWAPWRGGANAQPKGLAHNFVDFATILRGHSQLSSSYFSLYSSSSYLLLLLRVAEFWAPWG